MLSVRDITTQTLSMGLTINNLNLWRRPDGSSVLVRHFEDQALRQSQYSTSAVRAKAQFRLRRELSRTIRPSLTPALRLGLVGTRHTGALALMALQHKVVHVIHCQSLRSCWKYCLLLYLLFCSQLHHFQPIRQFYFSLLDITYPFIKVSFSSFIISLKTANMRIQIFNHCFYLFDRLLDIIIAVLYVIHVIMETIPIIYN